MIMLRLMSKRLAAMKLKIEEEKKESKNVRKGKKNKTKSQAQNIDCQNDIKHILAQSYIWKGTKTDIRWENSLLIYIYKGWWHTELYSCKERNSKMKMRLLIIIWEMQTSITICLYFSNAFLQLYLSWSYDSIVFKKPESFIVCKEVIW